MKTGLILQARVGSTRFSNKVLADILGESMIWWVMHRVEKAKTPNIFILATTLNPEDDALVPIVEKKGWNLFRGSEEDVLDRYYQAAKFYTLDAIIRITGDCPLIDCKIIDKIADRFLKNSVDYATNTLKLTYPDGMDVEVFSYNALEKMWKEARLPSEREHVTPYIRKNPHLFELLNIENSKNLAHIRLSVDYEEDLELIREIYKALYKPGEIFHLDEIMSFLDKNPHLLEINRHIPINEGYLKSLREDEDALGKKGTAKKARPLNLTKSFELYEKARKFIPVQSQTFSKGPDYFVKGVYPVYLQRGEGCYVWDVGGNKYIDYITALGPITLGYIYPRVNEAIKKQLEDGIIFSLPHPLEIEVSELLCKIIPCAEMVRFSKTGSEVTSAAIRAARAYTGKEKIIYGSYHGWHEWYSVTTSRDKGIPRVMKELVIPFEYNNIDSLIKAFENNPNQVAAVIMEPVIMEEPKDGFLKQVKEITHQNGAILIFDEIVTGFRFSLGGAQEYFNVIPDLATFGKGMANGMPLSAVVGKKEVMKEFEEVFFSTTFGGETLSLAACKATILEMRERNTIEHLWHIGERFVKGLNAIAQGIGIDAKCIGYPVHPKIIIGDDTPEVKSLFLQETVRRGVLFHFGGINFCYAHKDEHIEQTLKVCKEALELVKGALDRDKVRDWLEGEPYKMVFRRN